ncbi:hypothetical protein [Vagococcus fluvialis]|uniref:hypothetical protein n=1 Tax=Vagococcus fluvialis TaxID=2738 RepID=UPI001D0B85F7|nr:hypothetical protein [Vagococcus fluvialis]UDM72716.1 hypothetical protein K5L00_15125 [Vagococcus fluvialis]UDM78438.1 hypothetical protein K5K98_14455 [Vagococcus fluvialis]UDM83991.1 hypothetical protein K5K96_14275 [Vagococcus fluvialis]
MRSGKIQGIGVIVAIAFAIIMLTAGRVVPQSEIEAKEAKVAAQKEIEKVKFESGFIEMKNDKGVELESFDPEKDSKNRYEVNDGDIYTFTFALIEKDTYKKIDPTKVDLSKFYIETNNVHINFHVPTNIEYIEETGVIRFSSQARVNQSHGVGDVDLELSLVSSKEDVRVIKMDMIPITSPYAAEKVVNNVETKEENSNEAQQSSPESFGRGSLPDQKIDAENIDDWDHILDEDEIEDYSFEEGLL